MWGIYLLLNSHARFLYRALNIHLPISPLPSHPPNPHNPSSSLLPLPLPQKARLPTTLPPLSLSHPSNIHRIPHPPPPLPSPNKCRYGMRCDAMHDLETTYCTYLRSTSSSSSSSSSSFRGVRGRVLQYVREVLYVCMYVFIYLGEVAFAEGKMVLRE